VIKTLVMEDDERRPLLVLMHGIVQRVAAGAVQHRRPRTSIEPTAKSH
jgi:hypothetical protein